MISTEIDAVISLLRQVSTSEILPYFKNLQQDETRSKSGPLDPVTIADERAERALIAGLAKLFPGDDVLGEEMAAADMSQLERLKQGGRVWVVDPIDGTANFASELPLFGVMLALIENDEVLAGFIHDPIGDDTAVAIAGGGAWMVAKTGKRRPLQVAPPAPLKDMAGSISWRYLSEPLGSRIRERMVQLGAVTDYRCAAHQYRMLAGGYCHIQIFRRLYPWDHAAGVLLHREAGGFARQFDGAIYRPSVINGGLILAPDEASWQALATLFLS